MGEKETRDEASNLNPSRSNRVAAEEGEGIAIDESGVHRAAMASGGGDEPPEAIINTSHSNIKNLSDADDPGNDGPDSAERNATKTRSNIQNNREAAADPGDDGPESAEGTIVKSKSNITNN